jgi:hypothetical protein
VRILQFRQLTRPNYVTCQSWLPPRNSVLVMYWSISLMVLRFQFVPLPTSMTTQDLLNDIKDLKTDFVMAVESIHANDKLLSITKSNYRNILKIKEILNQLREKDTFTKKDLLLFRNTIKKATKKIKTKGKTC